MQGDSTDLQVPPRFTGYDDVARSTRACCYRRRRLMREAPGLTCMGIIWTDPDGTEHTGRFAGANPLAISVNESRVVPAQAIVGMWRTIDSIKAANVRGSLPSFTTAHLLETFKIKYDGWSTSFSIVGGKTRPSCVKDLQDAFWGEPVHISQLRWR